MSYEALIRTRIAAPLDMDDTTINLTADHSQRMAKGYNDKGVLMPDNPNEIQAAGAIKSTVADMLRYARWHLAEKDAAVRLSHQPVLTLGTYSAGLNWQMVAAEGRRVIWQEGNIDGFNSYCILQPEANLALVILANEEDRQLSHQLALLANSVMSQLDPRVVAMP